MSNWSIIGDRFAAQGWQCPVCGAVYSPTTPMCYNCTGKTATTTYASSTGKTESTRTESYNELEYIPKELRSIAGVDNKEDP